MKLRFTWLMGLGLLSAVFVFSLFVEGGRVEANNDKDFEVWVIDQSNSPGTAFGGTLYIYGGEDLIKEARTAVPAMIDLGGAVSTQCRADTEANPVRPHIVGFNGNHTVAILSFVASGHVVFMDAATRSPIKCFRMTEGVGGARQAHAAFAAPNNRYVIVANQNGKLLERINTDANNNGIPYEDADDIVHDTAATLNLATCTTPNQVACEVPGVRPNNTVICPIIDRTSTLTFVTLGGGGLLVVDTSAKGRIPSIIAEYDNSTVHPNGCGGMQKGIATESRIYLNSGAGTHPSEADLYSFPLSGFPVAPAFNPPNTPAPAVIFSFDTEEGHDSHSIVKYPFSPTSF